MTNLLDSLNSDYIKNVLPFLFKSATENSVTDFLSGYGSNSYNIKLDIKSLLECAPEYRPNDTNFIHFTSLRALHSILNEIGLRMYDLTGMNDPKEFEFIAKEFGFNDFQLKFHKERTHIFSMCSADILESTDILNMWRFYGGEGSGCAIEFEIDDPIRAISSIKIAKVNYVKLDYSEFFDANKKFEERNNRIVDLKDIIQIPACLHKDPIYKTESEVRLFHEDGSQRPEKSFEENSIFGYDINSKNKIVSYHKVKLYNLEIGEPHIVIKRIQLGFKFPEDKLKDLREHITFIYFGIMKRLGRKIEIPVVEISPLKGKYE